MWRIVATTIATTIVAAGKRLLLLLLLLLLPLPLLLLLVVRWLCRGVITLGKEINAVREREHGDGG